MSRCIPTELPLLPPDVDVLDVRPQLGPSNIRHPVPQRM
jgi:hypothetical protein